MSDKDQSEAEKQQAVRDHLAAVERARLARVAAQRDRESKKGE